jgi:hypothetical protein
MHKRHPLLIPSGGFCYKVLPVPHEKGASIHDSEFGRGLREAEWPPDETIQLCPYWMRTGHGTVCCEYLKMEALEIRDGAYALAVSHFGADRASAIDDSLLGDMIKVCKVRSDDPVKFAELFKSEAP